MSSILEQIYVGSETEHGFLLPGFIIKSAYCTVLVKVSVMKHG
jgi:hypothetical protein